MNIQFARALKQLRNASDNLSAVAAGNGDGVCLLASALVMTTANALIHGATYKTVEFAKEFDLENERKENEKHTN